VLADFARFEDFSPLGGAKRPKGSLPSQAGRAAQNDFGGRRRSGGFEREAVARLTGRAQAATGDGLIDLPFGWYFLWRCR